MQKLQLTGMQIIEGGQHLPNPIEEAYCEFVIERYLTSPIFNIIYFVEYNHCINLGYGGDSGN